MLSAYSFNSAAMNVSAYINARRDRGYNIAAVQYGNAECSMSCSGNQNDTCGGTWRNQLYTHARVVKKDNLPSPWTYEGCYVDSTNRLLSDYHYSSSYMNVTYCIAECKTRGFT
ncbi:hypothetical protein BJ742DRAFT_380772 [Cladochytrium replicatum]|nr:hypothetical protein BJ742DRAFT_380772 [Cladochytrium replicatum]